MKKKTPLAVVSCDKEILELANESSGFQVVGFFDSNPSVSFGKNRHLGPDESWLSVKKNRPGLKAIIALDPPEVKARLLEHYGEAHMASLRSKNAFLSKTAQVGPGAIIQQGVRVLAAARIGKACKLNINVVVHHDSQVGDCCTLAPGSQLLGRVVLEDQVFVGAGAIILPGIRVGRGSVIGAGAVVTRNVPPGSKVAGVPAHPLERKG